MNHNGSELFLKENNYFVLANMAESGGQLSAPTEGVQMRGLTSYVTTFIASKGRIMRYHETQWSGIISEGEFLVFL